MGFDDRAKKHLALYKSGATEQGIWKKRGTKYPHILPESEQALNILEPYRDDFWSWIPSQTGLKLHMDFHHLNSSQALCFNLFAPFVLEKRIALLCDILGVAPVQGGAAPGESRFERVFDLEEGTNFDFFLQPGPDVRLYFEVKYTESHFSATMDDDRHNRKLETIYRPRLAGKVKPQYLEGHSFFSNYQILRNLSYLDLQSHVFFIIPRANENLAAGLQVIEDAPIAKFRDAIHVAFLEELLDRILASSVSERMRKHFDQFRVKYIVV